MQRLRCGFSHDYDKLRGQTCARLLDVKRIDRDDIHEDAVDYDTEWYDANLNQHFFNLEPGKYLRMTFIGNKGIPFTTYRTDTVEHFDKYANNVGKWFEIYVKEDAK